LPIYQFLDDNGDPLAGGLVNSYLSGTATRQPTYSAPTISVPNQNANPLVLDAAGRGVIYVDNSVSYKIVVTNSAGAGGWTRDLIPSPDVAD
jgi:hypothetical protein